jgi:hypothetical protein
MKICNFAVLLLANLIAPAHAEDAICKPLGKLAVDAARERESGKTIEQTYLKMVDEGRIETTGDTAEWAANTVAWVYEERISSKAVEKAMLQKCRRAFSKKP